MAKLAAEKFTESGRPLRLAIDTSIWLFQIQSGKGDACPTVHSNLIADTYIGGTNPALRTFYYRLLRMMSLNINPLFVFDGPNKPPFKRNKRTGPNVASIPEFLAKQLLKHFGYPMHLAPGEAEAECALLQQEGVVDAVLSEDVDTLMFGSRATIRNWTAQEKGKTPTHVNLYNTDDTKKSSGLDREGMILVALMSGGDYVPQGIPGCGPKIACEAARGGFGHDLCKIHKNDKTGFQTWRERLSHELRTNESKFFKSKHCALKIPDDFPSTEILGYYTNPAISTFEKVQELKSRLTWDKDIDFQELRSFTGDAFDWRNFSGAKKFVRNLAQSLLIRELRLGTQSGRTGLVKGIHQVRTHASTDLLSELRISYIPIEIVNIDLSAEPPDDEIQVEQLDSDELNLDADEQAEPSTQSAKSRPYLYDPTQVEKIWVPEIFVKIGEPALFAEWEKRVSKPSGQQGSGKASVPKNTRGYKTKSKGNDRNIAKGALDSFLQVTKNPTLSSTVGGNTLVSQLSKATAQPFRVSQTSTFRPPPPRPNTPPQAAISLLSSSPIRNISTAAKDVTPAKINDWLDLPSTVTKRRKRSPIKRATSQVSNMSIDEVFSQNKQADRLDSLSSTKQDTLPENTPKRSKNTVKTGRRKAPLSNTENDLEILSSPSKSSIIYYFPQRLREQDSDPPEPLLNTTTDIAYLDLTMSSPYTAKSHLRNSQKHTSTNYDIIDEELCQYGDDHLDLPKQPEQVLNNEYPERRMLLTIDLTNSSATKQRQHITDSKDKSSPTTQRSQQQQISPVNKLKDNTTPIRRSPRLARPKEKSPKQAPAKFDVDQQTRLTHAPGNSKKKWVRVRESMAGAFALEEHGSPQSLKKREGMWKISDMKVVDLS